MPILIGIVVVLALIIAHDLLQRRHAILRTFPVLGHFRYLLEKVGPELRQYIVTSNDEERPFSRDQRRWIYASAKKQNNYFGFGTDNDLERCANQVIIKHAAFPASIAGPDQVGGPPDFAVPCAKVLGGWRERPKAFRPRSIINISGMSFGALSSRAVETMNLGAQLAGCMHNTGEGGLTSYHQVGGDLILQIGTGYFGVRDADGHFDESRLTGLVAANPIKAIEIKLSQGAKPGHGGVLPAAKVTAEIARFRGVRQGEDCISPPGHSEFHDVPSLVAFIEKLAAVTGLPVGIKSAVGESAFFDELAAYMAEHQQGPDFITIDGGEGGTGAAPLVFADNVSLPFRIGVSRAYAAFAAHGMHENVVFIGSGRLGFPEQTIAALSLGCDMINIAREAMIAIGCIQAQRCHTNHCPTGVATQSKWLMRGVDPTSKSARLANYIVTLRKELLELSAACGVIHPALIAQDRVELLDGHGGSRPIAELFGYEPGWGFPGQDDVRELIEYLRPDERVAPHRAGTSKPGDIDTRGQGTEIETHHAREAGSSSLGSSDPEPAGTAR